VGFLVHPQRDVRSVNSMYLEVFALFSVVLIFPRLCSRVSVVLFQHLCDFLDFEFLLGTLTAQGRAEF
jgi:hypothetical protein